MKNFKEGDYIALKHPNLAYSEEEQEQDVYIEYLRIYEEYKNRRYKIDYVEDNECGVTIEGIHYKFFFNEIILAKPKNINKIKIS